MFTLFSSVGLGEKVQMQSGERARGAINGGSLQEGWRASPLSGGRAAVKSGSINQLPLYQTR